MIIGFTGTRQGPTPAQHAAMNRLLLRLFTKHGATALIHGGAVGCDTFAHYVVSPHAPILIFPSTEGPNSSVVTTPMGNSIIAEPTPALYRNRLIAGCVDGLVAVPASDTEGPTGTWATVRYARKFGCPVVIIRKDGKAILDAHQSTIPYNGTPCICGKRREEDCLPNDCDQRYERSDAWPFVKRKVGNIVQRCADCRIDEVRFLCRDPSECWQGRGNPL